MTDATPIRSFPVSDTIGRIWAEIERLDLVRNIAELEAFGFTVVPPEKVAPPEVIANLKERVLDVAERRTGSRPRIDATAADVGREYQDAFGLPLPYLTFEDWAFQEAIVNPAALAIVTYLLGESCRLSDCAALIKGPGGTDLSLHADNLRIPDPFPPLAQICNVTWCLTDYSLENGSISFVPGSHRYYRRPLDGEGVEQRVAITAPAGSLIIFSGHTWHGAFARTAPGLRVSLIGYYCRAHILPQGDYSREAVPADIIERNSPRFATLMGSHITYGYRSEGPPSVQAIIKKQKARVVSSAEAVGKHAFD